MSGFTDCFERIARAHRHGQAAADLWNNLFADNASTFTIEVESEGVAVVSAVFAKPIGNGIDIALELGELFYQLRAALDGAAFELATLLSAPHSPTDESRLYFPIYAKPRYFVDSAFNRNPFPQELKDWIESIQPCHAHKLTDAKQSQVAGLLKHINDLASKDRHRRLHVVGVTPTDIGGHIEIGRPGRITFTEAIPCNFFEGQSKFLRIGFENITDGKLKVDAHLMPEIYADEIPFAPPWQFLHATLEGTRYVIERFEMIGSGKSLTF